MAVRALSAAELRRQRSSVRGLLRAVNDEIATLPLPALRAVLPALAEARRELERDLRSWLARKGGDERFTTQHYRAALVQIRSALDQAGELEPELLAALRAGGHQAGRLAAAHVQLELAVFSVHFGSTLRPVPIVPAAVLARGDRLLIPRFRSSAARYAANVRADLQRQLAVGLVRGETFDELARRLVALGGPRGWVALRGVAGEPGSYSEQIAEGLFRRYTHWARRIVNTEVLGAYNVQAHEALVLVHKDDPRIMQRWDASVDSRLCDDCKRLDHEAVPLGERFPGGYDAPPAHPYCRCSLVAWRSDWSEVGAVKGGEAAEG